MASLVIFDKQSKKEVAWCEEGVKKNCQNFRYCLENIIDQTKLVREDHECQSS